MNRRIRAILPLTLILVGQGVQSAMNFLSGVLVGRHNAASGLGDFAIGMAVIFMSSIVADALFSTPMTYAIVRHRCARSREQAFAVAFVGTIALSGLIACVVLALTLISDRLAFLLPAVPCAVAGILPREIIRRNYYAKGEPLYALISDGLTVLAQVALFGIVLSRGTLSPATAFWLMGLANLGAAVIGLPRHLWSLRSAVIVKHVSAFFEEGRWLVAGNLCLMLALQLPAWLLYFLVNASATGAFNAAISIASLPNPVIAGLTNFSRPAVAQAYRDDGWSGLINKVLLLLPVFVFPGLVCTVILGGFGSHIVSFVYGKSFVDVGSANLLVASLATVAMATTGPLQSAVLALAYPQAILWMHFAEVAVAIVAVLPLVAALGTLGALLGYMVSMVSGCVVIGLLLARISKYKMRLVS